MSAVWSKDWGVCKRMHPLRSSIHQQASLPSGLTTEAESANIRDKFPFEPEREDDGSLKIQAIIGRRLRKEEHATTSMHRVRESECYGH